MSYRIVSSLVAVICLILFALFVVLPQTYAPTYGVAADTGAIFITRRAGPLFLGLAVILWLSRDEPRSKLRDAVAYGAAICFLGIAVTGVFECMSGVASAAILVASVAETALAALLVYTSQKSS